MQFSADGWRSARSRRHYPEGMPAPAPQAPAPPAPPRAAQRSRAAAPAPVSGAAAVARPSLRELWRLVTDGVEWTPVYVGFLVYVFVVTTFQLNVADWAIGIAAVGLLVQREPLRFPPLLLWFAVYIAWGFIGYTQSDYGPTVFKRLEDMAKLWVIVLVAVNALRTRAQLRFFLLFFLAAYAFYPVRGAYFNYYLYGQKPGGRAVWKFTYDNPNDLATLSILALSICAGVIYTEREKIIRTLSLVGVGMLTLLVFMTQSRGAIIALSVFAIFALRNSKRAQRARTFVIFGAVAAVLAMFAPSSVWDRLKGLENVTNTENLREVDEEGSAEQRFEIWRVARKIIRTNPISGVGLGAYKNAHEVYAMDSEFKRTARGNRDTHSTLLNVAAESGFVGLMIFVGMFATLAWRAEKVRRRARTVLPDTAQQLTYLMLGLLAYFLAGLFGSYGHLNFTYIFAALLWAFVQKTDEEVTATLGATGGGYAPTHRRAPTASVRLAGRRA